MSDLIILLWNDFLSLSLLSFSRSFFLWNVSSKLWKNSCNRSFCGPTFFLRTKAIWVEFTSVFRQVEHFSTTVDTIAGQQQDLRFCIEINYTHAVIPHWNNHLVLLAKSIYLYHLIFTASIFTLENVHSVVIHLCTYLLSLAFCVVFWFFLGNKFFLCFDFVMGFPDRNINYHQFYVSSFVKKSHLEVRKLIAIYGLTRCIAVISIFQSVKIKMVKIEQYKQKL